MSKCGNSTYYISQEGEELNENVKEIIRTSPKQNLTSQEFYAEFYKLQMRYAKYLDDIEWVSNDLQQFENQSNGFQMIFSNLKIRKILNDKHKMTICIGIYSDIIAIITKYIH